MELTNNNINDNKNNDCSNNDQENNPKSPKSPKLHEEVSEMKITENSEEEQKQQEEEAKEELSDDQNDFKVELDPKVVKVLEELFSKAPAGQVKNASNLCQELFAADYKEVIEEECAKKMAKDAHFDGENLITEDSEDGSDGSDDEFIKELDIKLKDYIRELYPGSGSFKIVKQSAANEYSVHILGQKSKEKAFWSGHWHSQWTINCQSEEGEGAAAAAYTVAGIIDLIVHYHEEGSVQLSATKSIPSRSALKSSSPCTAAEKVYWRIKDSEDALQVALNEAYQQLADNIFKKLRRQLPVTRTKMDWDKFSNYNLSNELKE